MISLKKKLEYVGAAFADAVPHSYHYFRPNEIYPALVWQEDGEETSFHAGNHKAEQAIHGTTDYYTQQEYDTAIDTVQDTLEAIAAAWTLQSVQYEEDTKLIHYEWEWTVAEKKAVVPDGE